MPATDPAVRKALGQQAIHTRWRNTEAADEAARTAQSLLLERDIRRTLDDPGLTIEQRARLAGILTGAVR